MGRYIQQSDIENAYGLTYVAQWSSFTGGNNPPANATRIASAIAFAEDRHDEMLANSQYLIPLVPTTAGVTVLATTIEICSELAGHWLWKSRALHQSKEITAMMAMRYKQAILRLLAISNGSYKLAATADATHVNVPTTGW